MRYHKGYTMIDFIVDMTIFCIFVGIFVPPILHTLERHNNPVEVSK